MRPWLTAKRRGRVYHQLLAGTQMRTLIVEGDEQVRSLLSWLLADDPRFQLVGSVGTGDEAARWDSPLDAAVDLAIPASTPCRPFGRSRRATPPSRS